MGPPIPTPTPCGAELLQGALGWVRRQHLERPGLVDWLESLGRADRRSEEGGTVVGHEGLLCTPPLYPGTACSALQYIQSKELRVLHDGDSLRHGGCRTQALPAFHWGAHPPPGLSAS